MEDQEVASLVDGVVDFQRRRQWHRARYLATRPKPIANVLSQLMARKGYGQVMSAGQLDEAWTAAAGPTLTSQTRVGRLRRGVLEVFVANSTLLQELSFEKRKLLTRLKKSDDRVTDLRFRVGSIR